MCLISLPLSGWASAPHGGRRWWGALRLVSPCTELLGGWGPWLSSWHPWEAVTMGPRGILTPLVSPR